MVLVDQILMSRDTLAHANALIERHLRHPDWKRFGIPASPHITGAWKGFGRLSSVGTLWGSRQAHFTVAADESMNLVGCLHSGSVTT